MTGANGRDLRIPVPPGTVVRDAKTHELLGDLTQPKAELTVAKGGTPGKGNARFASSTNQAPRMATNGLPGEERALDLELKLIADVGLVGLPNAGKSTLLASTTAARPKIAPYPFTTLEPNLGVVDLDRETSFVIADIPGLIEGASAGKGLGHEFLRHIERTRILIHLLDGSLPDPIGDFDTINAELAAFGHGLAGKMQIVAFNKIDLVEAQDNWKKAHAVLKKRGVEAMTLSAAAHTNTRELMYRAVQLLKELPEPVPLELGTAIPVIKLEEGSEPFTISRDDAGAWHVTGQQVERLALRHRFDSEESLMAFQRAVNKLGVIEALRKAGVQEGDTVWIGADYELEWQD